LRKGDIGETDFQATAWHIWHVLSNTHKLTSWLRIVSHWIRSAIYPLIKANMALEVCMCCCIPALMASWMVF